MKKLMNQNWFIAIVFMVLYKPAIFSQMPQYQTFDKISNVLKVLIIAVPVSYTHLTLPTNSRV